MHCKKILYSGTVKAMGLNQTRSMDLKTDWLSFEFNDSDYQGDVETVFQNNWSRTIL